MDAVELDRVLTRLRSQADNATANLLELEALPTVALLQHATLRGESQRRWAEAQAHLSNVWRWGAQLSDLFGRVNDQRRGVWSGRDAVWFLLLGLSIDAVVREVPLAERSLVDAELEVRTVSPDELLGMMAVEFELARAVVVQIAHVWEELAPLAHAALVELDADVTLRELQRAMAEDPLSVGDDDVAEALRPVEALRRQRALAADLRDHLDERIDAARRVVAEVLALDHGAQEARRRATARIAEPALPPRTAVGTDLQRRLDAVVDIAGGGDWAAAAADLDRLVEHLDQLQTLLADERDAARRPVDERDRLRGLLGASRAQARRVGLSEDDALHSCYEQALESLTVAPTDLDAAALLVERYRAELAARREVAS